MNSSKFVWVANVVYEEMLIAAVSRSQARLSSSEQKIFQASTLNHGLKKSIDSGAHPDAEDASITATAGL